jgi:DNA-binding XRE family transcriptional regulator
MSPYREKEKLFPSSKNTQGSVRQEAGWDRRITESPEKLLGKGIYQQGELARNAEISLVTIDPIENGKSCRLETKRKIILALGLELSEA